MKKILSALALSLSLLLFMTACDCNGCNGESKLTGTAYWHKNKTFSSTFSETCVYEINYLSDYKLDSSVQKFDYSAKAISGVEISYEQGSLITQTTAITGSEVPAGIEINPASTLYKMTQDFALSVSYRFTGDGSIYDFTDTIRSEVYFKTIQESLAPVYSIKTYDNTCYENSSIVRRAYTTTIKWNDKAELTISDNTNSADFDKLYDNDSHYKVVAVNNSVSSVKYTAGTILDNEQLFFSIRALTPSSSFSYSLKTLDTAYKSAQTLKAAYVNTISVADGWQLKIGDFTKTYGNYEPKAEVHDNSTNTYVLSVQRGVSNQSGTAKLCYYQVLGNDEYSRGFLVKIVDALPSHTGALEYALKSVTIQD